MEKSNGFIKEMACTERDALPGVREDDDALFVLGMLLLPGFFATCSRQNRLLTVVLWCRLKSNISGVFFIYCHGGKCTFGWDLLQYLEAFPVNALLKISVRVAWFLTQTICKPRAQFRQVVFALCWFSAFLAWCFYRVHFCAYRCLRIQCHLQW